jgi:stage II sporulation protein D
MRRSSFVCALLAAVASACVAPTRGTGGQAPLADVPSERASMPPVAARTVAAAELTLPAAVRVRLEGLERKSALEVLMPDGEPHTLRLVGREVVDAEGRRGKSLVLAAPQDGVLRVAGRAYTGALVVTPHPELGLRVHNEVALESYVAGVVAAELALWSALPTELEAQAIAARTYAVGQLALRAREREAVELVDGVMDQAYRGLYQPNSAAERSIAERLDAAVRATSGVVLLRGERFEEARFHASCGGTTAAFADVFPEPGPGPPGTACEPCRARAAAEAAKGEPDPKRPLGWRVTVPQEALVRAGKALGLDGPIQALGPKKLDPSGRWLEVQLRGPKGLSVVPFDSLRRALGYGEVKGARIVSASPPFGTPLRAGVTLMGLGRGHGVGLCQEGTRDLARQGWSAEQILAAYYPGARLARVAPRAVEAAHRP